MKKYVIVSIVTIVILLLLVVSYSIGKFDVVRDTSVNSFNDLMVSGLEKKRDGNSWIVTLPDQTSSLVLKTEKNETTVSIVIDANPFLNAGLDSAKLPSYMKVANNKLYITSVYGNVAFKNNSIALDNIFNNIVINYRHNLSYHSVLDHFGLAVEDGNSFEFAKDVSENDKDIVIVLNPNTLKSASVDLEKVSGYDLMDVKMDDGESVKKLLKVFNIEEVTQCLITKESC